MATSQIAEPVLRHTKLQYQERQLTSPFDDFLRELVDPEHSEPLPIMVDTTLPLFNFFISSSHNTYLTGNQLWSNASTHPYQDCLKRGCRSVEIDVWDGRPSSASSSDTEMDADHKGPDVTTKLTGMFKKNLGRFHSKSTDKKEDTARESTAAAGEHASDEPKMPTPWRATSEREEPRVLHGHTATKEIPFRKVCEAIRDYAFFATDLPLIISLEVHCTHDQQATMVDIMTEYWNEYLVVAPEGFSDQTPMPSLESLKRKILVKVKYSPPKKNKPSSSRHPAEGDSSDEEGQAEIEKNGKIIERLSNMGVYVRSCHFSSLKQPEATIPTHVFSVSEKKIFSLLEEDSNALSNHNANYLMRAYPKGTRVRSTNLDPCPFWRQGVQMVALNWQEMNAANMLNDAMFAGSGGWVEKPAGFLGTGVQQDSIVRRDLNLSIMLLAGQKLDPGSTTAPRVYIRSELHVESKSEKEAGIIPEEGIVKSGEWKRNSAVIHSRDPDFDGEKLEFKGVSDVIPELSFLRIKVMDDDAFQKDRLLGWACFRLDRLPQGLRLLRLKGADASPTGGAILTKIHLDWRR